jgi:hypothetical protein
MSATISAAGARIEYGDLPRLHMSEVHLQQLLQNIIGTLSNIAVPSRRKFRFNRSAMGATGLSVLQTTALALSLATNKESSSRSNGCIAMTNIRAPALGWRCARKSCSDTTAAFG